MFYRPQTKFGARKCFTPVCDSVNEGCTPPQTDTTLQADNLLGRHPRADTLLLGRHPPRADTPPPKMVTEAGGTHPTGMHSCLKFV